MGARRGTAVYLGALLGAVLLSGCGSGGAAPAVPLPEAGLTTPAELPGDWPVARPEELGIEEPYAGSDLERLNGSAGDWVRFVLDRPMREAPGTRWQYNSGGVIVLAGVLRSATGGDPGEFARRQLYHSRRPALRRHPSRGRLA